LGQDTKTGENVPNDHTLYQTATKIPNGRLKDQTSISYANILHRKTLQNLPKSGFLDLSGNPDDVLSAARHPQTSTFWNLKLCHLGLEP
jgi:hypothetical protein